MSDMASRTLLTDRERETLEAISGLALGNPFGPERLKWERQVLGDAFTPFDVVWHARGEARNPNVPRIQERAEELAAAMRERLSGERPGREDLGLYRDLVLYLLYGRYQEPLYGLIEEAKAGERPGRVPFYRGFRADFEHFLDLPRVRWEEPLDPEHAFACFFQIRRAFHFTFRSIVGGSMPAARLRAQVWQSIFTHDLRRYQRALYRSLGDATTLVTGPSGTGKELVARTIAWSRYLPFDPEAGFRETWLEAFFPLNLSALSPTLIESELFGHRRGAFTGAVADHTGWLEICPPLGTVFLDEIGEVDPAIQVKLLRVLETRTFQRLGESRPRRFQGKLVAATNRDLSAEIRAGRFRADLYYRLCSDILVTPSLKERIADSPRELSDLLVVLAQRAVGDDLAEEVAKEVETWIHENLEPDYPWPGNVRELAQCVNNVLIRRDYRPARLEEGASGVRERLAMEYLSGTLTADDLLRRYCTLVYAEAGSYEETARRLGLDRRTVKSRVDPDLLKEF
jgi:hypothetical protein